MRQKSIGLTILGVVILTMTVQAEVSWQTKLERDLPLLGHRNWIVIADAAYPWQAAEGIETIYTDGEQLDAVKAVLRALDKTTHVRPIIYTDTELQFVPEESAKGITAYRNALGKLLDKRNVQSLPHEEVIKKLDEAGKTFHVLILKTELTIPYTSVFLQLDCGYWSAESEQKLRDAMKRVP